MATLPGTGSQISFGRVNKVFTNNDPGAAGNAPSGGQNIKLSAILGNNAAYGIGQGVGTTIRFSNTFGNKSGPYG
jgi:hypothetical protein